MKIRAALEYINANRTKPVYYNDGKKVRSFSMLKDGTIVGGKDGETVNKTWKLITAFAASGGEFQNYASLATAPSKDFVHPATVAQKLVSSLIGI